MVALLLFAVLVFTIPGSAMADNVPGYKSIGSMVAVIDKETSDASEYSLKVIEEDPVPLSSGAKDYSAPVMPIVLICLAAAFMTMYWAWFNGHRKRIAELMVMGLNDGSEIGDMGDVSIFHPIRTIRFEAELENRVVTDTAKGV